jgi:hypothetical protein
MYSWRKCAGSAFIIFLSMVTGCALSSGGDEDTNPPAETVKIIFIHHSCGSNWLATGNGGLGAALNRNNYYVNETDYEWDAEPDDNLGDHTDTTAWPSWFNDTKMPYVYQNDFHAAYSDNTMADPGGENSIIMFKSCFPNSEVGGSINDEKAIYSSLLPYFGAHTDKMFVLVVPPPERDIDSAPLTRQLANWLSDYDNGWLGAYSGGNVFVFDFYNVLTGPANHHWVTGGDIKHIVAPSSGNELYYPSNDNHPSAAGNRKATAEFVPLLNAYYHKWRGE